MVPFAFAIRSRPGLIGTAVLHAGLMVDFAPGASFPFGLADGACPRRRLLTLLHGTPLLSRAPQPRMPMNPTKNLFVPVLLLVAACATR